MGEPTEIKTFAASKRCGIQQCPWMTNGDWFTSWSPRNDNNNAEGTWHHWANLAAFILSHPATQAVAPELYRPDLPVDRQMYVGGKMLSEAQVRELFPEQPTP